MGSIVADKVTERASILLLDRTKKQWQEEELLQWLNDGQLMILQFRPDAYTQNRVVQLIEGSRQAVPLEDLRLIDMPRNMGADGLTPGRACRYIDRKMMDLSDPNWHAATADSNVLHWMYDQEVPKTFWVYPPQPTNARGYVEIDVSALPPALTIDGIDGAGVTTALALDDTWVNSLLAFCVFRAQSKDSEATQVGGKASSAWQEFLMTLNLKTRAHIQFDPKKHQPPRYNAPAKSDTQGAFGEP